MKLIEVKDKQSEKDFLMFPVQLYKNEKHWIRPLDKDINNVFDKDKNKYYRKGELIRWILKDDSGKIIGRVAAFINKKTVNKDNDQPTGGMGFFECINDKKAAFILFDACRDWLKDNGTEAMDGPINFGDRDKWWGLLVKGFEIDPNYNCNYQLPYYQALFEEYGFKTYFEQITFARKIMDPINPRLQEKAERIFQNPKYSFRHMKLKEIDAYTVFFMDIYNAAWASHKGVPQLSLQMAKHLMKQMKPIIDEKIMWFGFYEEKPIAFYIMLPEVNQIFKYVNGKMDLIGKLKFAWHQWRKTNKKMFGVVFGIVPDHQGKGVEGAIIETVRRRVQGDYRRYEDFEMNWIGDFNVRMIHVVEQVGGDRAKIHKTYRYLFDRTKPFKRMPIIGDKRKKNEEESA
ncbi:MAG: hypothetical protein KAI99_00575 [Cyclobacteriaceae bacterium]|nr:hypothetical protein [Cyclobacteriaceae bacterium]MCK5466961.1 hypothetical protein [Cyclobacteriaceae bacterium]MCK5705018.1 hypothetical protein [Cyclobacteriaceae bacterium]